MAEELSSTLIRLARVEDKFKLYEPMFISLHGIASVPDEIEKIQAALRLLSDSRIEVKEKITTLFKAQDRVYREIVKVLEEKTRLLEKEIAECPIQVTVGKVFELTEKINLVTREIDLIEALDDRLEKAEKLIDSFKLKGWDLLFRIVPWIIAFIASGYAMLSN